MRLENIDEQGQDDDQAEDDDDDQTEVKQALRPPTPPGGEQLPRATSTPIPPPVFDFRFPPRPAVPPPRVPPPPSVAGSGSTDDMEVIFFEINIYFN